jgi:hypothetical protein
LFDLQLQSLHPLEILMIVRTLLLIATAAASSSIGHPVPTTLAGGTGITLDFAELPVHSMVVDRCDTTTETFEVMEVIDLHAGDPLTLPEGDICGVQLVLGGRLHASGSGSGGTFSLSLAVGQITIPVSPALEVVDGDSDATLVRIAESGWITATSLSLSSGTHVHIGPASGLHDGLRDSVRWDSDILQ